MCFGLRGHDRIKNTMYDEFDTEYLRAKRELKQLKSLFREVCWYNFETRCRNWQEPWHASFPGSEIELYAHRHLQLGKGFESCSFPIYYSGSIENAPALPPQILLEELKKAEQLIEYWDKQRTAPYDYAPGGREYEKLVRQSPGALGYDMLYQYNRLQSSKRKVNDVRTDERNLGESAAECGSRCVERDRLDKPVEARKEATKLELLAAVCGDRRLVPEEASGGCTRR